MYFVISIFLLQSIGSDLIDVTQLAHRFETLRNTAFGGAVDDRKRAIIEKLIDAGLEDKANAFVIQPE